MYLYIEHIKKLYERSENLQIQRAHSEIAQRFAQSEIGGGYALP